MKRANSRSREILKALDADIRDGRYLAGRPFPSETALARRFDVSRSLMTGVLNELEQSGLVVRRQGRGTFVATRVCARKIGLVIPGIAVSDFFQPILGELSRLARTNDYEINFGEVYSSSHDRRVRQVRELAAEFIRQRIAGVLYEPLVGERAEEVNMRILRVLGRKGIPVVLLDSDIVPFPARSAYDVVGTNDVKAGAQIAAHLLSCRGVRSVHFHLPPDGPITYDNRIFGATALIPCVSDPCLAPPVQVYCITNSNAGEGLIFYGSTIVPFKDDFPKDTQLYRIMTTRLEETVQN